MRDLSTVRHFLFVGTFLGVILLDLILVRLAAPLHRISLYDASRVMRLITVFILILMIIFSSWAMTLNPLWNGQSPDYPGQYDQYERIAESFLNGHLYFDNTLVDPRLQEMENPYDPFARRDSGVDYAWDHAYYNGHYYMYYGVVPVFLLFIPFRLITGASLTGYHATQVFVAAYFCGVFSLFRFLTGRFLKRMSYLSWIMLCVTVCFTSLWNCIACPALYNVPVSSALCMEVWSLFFFIRAVWGTESENRSVIFVFLGSLFGALAFGCRPNIALGNLLAVPLFFLYLNNHRPRVRLFLKLALAVLPYLAVGIALMWYNKARFDSPFEFGQSYQLTVADQSGYGGRSISSIHWVTVANGLIFNFFQSPVLLYEFPFVGAGGVFLAYPVFSYVFLAVADEESRRRIRESRLSAFLISFAVTAVLITLVNIMWSPFLTDRYREDFIWLIGILSFFCIGFRMEGLKNPEASSRWVCRWCIWSLAVGFLLGACDALL